MTCSLHGLDIVFGIEQQSTTGRQNQYYARLAIYEIFTFVFVFFCEKPINKFKFPNFKCKISKIYFRLQNT